MRMTDRQAPRSADRVRYEMTFDVDDRNAGRWIFVRTVTNGKLTVVQLHSVRHNDHTVAFPTENKSGADDWKTVYGRDISILCAVVWCKSNSAQLP